tara:strand:+ start:53 stop:604 length:552 start_codon:yes stop_codon:yes gene_type:complete
MNILQKVPWPLILIFSFIIITYNILSYIGIFGEKPTFISISGLFLLYTLMIIKVYSNTIKDTFSPFSINKLLKPKIWTILWYIFNITFYITLNHLFDITGSTLTNIFHGLFIVISLLLTILFILQTTSGLNLNKSYNFNIPYFGNMSFSKYFIILSMIFLIFTINNTIILMQITEEKLQRKLN